MKKLKARWGVESNFQLVIIFIVFAITGSTAAKFATPVTELFGLHADSASPWVYWPVRILAIFPLYQILLVFFGWVFGQFAFFWDFEKKMLSRLGLGFIVNKK
ncbi:DUF6787 family protein [Robertkochia aurantiaca]|uniref:DUF6787 family protein n=1 Tax=Robertkochia aurantiaca TaxID=2873700 RepID=UPI001CCF49F7|nr:DUF6787 family protein [Robertkochia sp. 3YJGBD-33]